MSAERKKHRIVPNQPPEEDVSAKETKAPVAPPFPTFVGKRSIQIIGKDGRPKTIIIGEPNQ